MSGSDGHRVLRSASRVALGAAFAGLLAIPAGAAWDGTQAIRLGDTVSAEFAVLEAGSESHVYSFYVPETTKVSAKASGKGLSLKLSLVDVGGLPVDVGAADDKAGQITPFGVAARGVYGFRVETAADGVGIYKMTTKPTYPKSFKAPSTFYASSPASKTSGGAVVNAFATSTFDFGLMAGTTVSVTIKPGKGSNADPRVKSLVGPSGPVKASDGTVITVGSTIKNLLISESGTYRLTIEDQSKGFNQDGTAVAVNTADTIALTVTPKWPKSKRSFCFGAVEISRGTQDEIRDLWLGSAHNAVNTEAFRHWDGDLPAEVPASCAKCHSTTGYRDYLGDDGSAYGVTNKPVPVSNGETVQCDACHNDAATNLTEVEFDSTRTDPLVVGSGVIVTGLGDEARCMVCHQGRESKVTIDRNIAAAAPADDDTVDATSSDGDGAISFRNIHYFAAAATLYGRDVGVGYEYPGLGYERKFTHVEAYDRCIDCHDPHTLKVKVSECADCHEIDPANLAADKFEEAIHDLHQARMDGTIADFDGDGELEGTYVELEGMGDMLYRTMQEYAKDVVGKPLIYDGHSYPYFFEDKGVIGTFEPGTDTGFNQWTARLVRAAFNYQMWQKDPGAFAHNGKYIMELMYDSIDNLNQHASVDVTKANGYPVDFASLVRNDSGHFDTSADAFRDWEDDEGVSAGCSRCHSLEGFRFRVKYGIDTTLNQPTVAGMQCESCHVSGTAFLENPERIFVKTVQFAFPTTATSAQKNSVTLTQPASTTDDSYVCMTCHGGRQSKLTVDATLAAATGSTVNFTHVHYFPAGATQNGRWASVGYPYPAKTYAARWDHTGGYNTAATPNFSASSNNTWSVVMGDSGKCTFCHMPEGSHAFEPEASACTQCHTFTNPADIRTISLYADYRGNYDNNAATTTLAAEVDAIAAALYTKIRDYARVTDTTTGPIHFENHQSPYWYKDPNDNDVLDAGETTRYGFKVDGKLLKAAYNYTLYARDPGAWAHNGKYMIQLLIDSIEDLGGDVSGFNRPTQG